MELGVAAIAALSILFEGGFDLPAMTVLEFSATAAPTGITALRF
jgi:hypothetical protein